MHTDDEGIHPGDRVRAVGRHWLRPHAFGWVSEIEPDRGEYMYLVEFDRTVVGKGIDGKFLWMDKLSFEVVRHDEGRTVGSFKNAPEGTDES